MRHPPFAVVAAGALGALALLPLLAGGCGGGGGSGVPTLVLGSVGAVDGSVDQFGFVDTTTGLLMGDSPADATIHGYYRFDVSSIPAGATVLSATLVTFQTGAGGTFGTPYSDLGALLVDHVDLGAVLGAEDYSGTTFTYAVAVLSSDMVLETKTADVTSEVQADRDANRTFSDFRLRFTIETNSDGAYDFVQFASAEVDAGTGVFPTLSVTYQP